MSSIMASKMVDALWACFMQMILRKSIFWKYELCIWLYGLQIDTCFGQNIFALAKAMYPTAYHCFG